MEEEVRFGKNAHQERLLGFGLGHLSKACYRMQLKHLDLTASFFFSTRNKTPESLLTFLFAYNSTEID